MSPTPWLDAARALVRQAYALDAQVSALPGENHNALVQTANARFVLKLSSHERTTDVQQFEHDIVEHLIAADVGLALPRTVLTSSKSVEGEWTGGDGTEWRGRLTAFVDGTPWCEGSPHGPELLVELGRAVGRLDRALESFRHAGGHRTHRWDLARAGQHRSKVSLIEGLDRREQAERLFELWASASSVLVSLPHAIIYGDANDENVLVSGRKVSGLLDFGDALDNPVVCELAIAVTYAMLDQDDPIGAGAIIVAGYHDRRPLSAVELDVLFPLVCGRLAASVTIAAERRQIDPGRQNWFVTENRAWKLIERLLAVAPHDVLARWDPRGPAPAPANSAARRDVRAQVAARHEHVSRALSISYREPLEIVRGSGQYLIDRTGRPYLDLVNNVCHVGHSHPEVVAAGQRQMAELNTNTRYLYDGLVQYTSRLVATLPSPLEVVFLVNSGSEANELALRLARTHTKRHAVAVVDHAYHGNTSTLIAMSPYKFKGRGGSGRPEPWVHVTPVPDPHGTPRASERSEPRSVATSAGVGPPGNWKKVDPQPRTGQQFADAAGEVFASAAPPIAAFFVEPLMSCAGQIVPPDGYLETAFTHARRAGIVCVADEVQVGFGRVGSHFWGFQHRGAIPDIVVMGKPIGNGHPMAAVVTTREIANSFEKGMEFFSTFGGNPVSCAIGLAVLDVIAREDLQARAAALGERFLRGLRSLADRHELIGDVRGAGLFIGVELVRNRREPAREEADALINDMRHRGVLLSTDGPHHNVLKIKPPMVLTEDDVDMAVRELDAALSAVQSRR